MAKYLITVSATVSATVEVDATSKQDAKLMAQHAVTGDYHQEGDRYDRMHGDIESCLRDKYSKYEDYVFSEHFIVERA